MTEPNCGSDLKALRTTEDKGDHYLVNGQKTFITLALCVIWRCGQKRIQIPKTRSYFTYNGINNGGFQQRNSI
jgi:hypothetical protein